MMKSTGKQAAIPYIIFMLWITGIFAQAPDTLWTKTFGGPSADMAYSVQLTADRGYIIAGYTRSYGAGGSDVYVIKTDSQGNAQWQKTYGGLNDDVGSSVKQTADGGYVIAGYTSSFGHGDNDVYVIRTDPFGDTIWTRTFGGTASDRGYSLALSSDGGFVVAGHTASFGIGCDVYVVKVNLLGILVWEKFYGGPEEDGAYSIAGMPDGGFIIAGDTRSFGTGAQDVYAIRLDDNGDSLWSRTYGGIDHYTASGVAATSDSGAIMIGITDSYGAMYGDYYLVRINKDGDTLWTRHYGGESTEWGYSVCQKSDGSYIAAGWSDSYWPGCQMYVIKLDAFGDTIWTKLLAGDGYAAAFAVNITPDGGYIIAGCTDTSDMGAPEDGYLVRMGPDVYGVSEQPTRCHSSGYMSSTIIRGALQLPAGKNCRIFDLTGRIVAPGTMRSGIYFLEADGKIIQKIIKVR
jgi:hypothetical protein